MKKLRVKISFIIIVLLLSLILTTLLVNAEEIKISYLYRITYAGTKEYQEWLVDTFNKKHEGSIQVEPIGIIDEVFKSKFITILRGSTPPDVFFCWEGGYAKNIIDSGVVEPIDRYYEKYHWADILSSAGVNLSIYDGQKYFVPTFMAASLVWYQTDIFKKYDLSVPNTWEELMEIASVLKANGIAPFMLADLKRWTAQFDWSAIFVNKYGVDIYKDLMDHKIPWTDDRVVATFEQMQNMINDGTYIAGALAIDLDPALIPFSKGEAAMWYQGTWMISRFKTIDLQIDCFPYPAIGSVKPTPSVFAEETVMLNSSSKYKDEAAEFINFIISKEAQEKLVEMYGPYPANKNVDLSNLSAVEQKVGEIIAKGGFTFMHPDHALLPSIADTYLNQLQGVLVGLVTPVDAAKEIERIATKFQGPVK